MPDQHNTGRFQYTGQAWVPEIGMFYYKARMYSPTLGRFMQTDPIGYGDGMNMYAYVGNDPLNGVDTTGLARCGRVSMGGQTGPVVCPLGWNSASNVRISRGRSLISIILEGAERFFDDDDGDDSSSIDATDVYQDCPVPEHEGALPFSAGVHVEAATEVGMGVASTHMSQNYTVFQLPNSETALMETGTVVSLETPNENWREGMGPSVAGSSGGLGPGLSFTNAQTSTDLVGFAQTTNVNVMMISTSFASGENGTWTLDVGLDFGAGLSVSTLETETTLVGSVGCLPPPSTP